MPGGAETTCDSWAMDMADQHPEYVLFNDRKLILVADLELNNSLSYQVVG